MRSGSKISMLLQFRSVIWWKGQETLSASKKRHRRSGAQTTGPLASVIKAAAYLWNWDTDEDLVAAANDRCWWRAAELTVLRAL
eukprot:4816785-Karenia_brevis.AAC.1